MYIDLKQQVLNNLKVTVTDNLENIKEATLDVTPDVTRPMNPNLTDMSLAGKVVNYTPKEGQVYNTEDGDWTTSKKDSTNYPEYSGTGFQYFQTSNLASEWKIWGTDNDYIYIISSTEVKTALRLKGNLGYNNGVTLLDNICDKCYTDKTTYPGSKGQNIKLEQLRAVMTSEAKNEEENDKITYFNINWPYLFESYGSWYSSKAYSLTSKHSTSEKKEYGIHFSVYHNGELNLKKYWKDEYRMLVFPNSTSYWLSSRQLSGGASQLIFGLQYVIGNGITYTNAMLWWDNTPNNYAHENIHSQYIRPIISFPSSMYELQEQSDGTYNIVKK